MVPKLNRIAAYRTAKTLAEWILGSRYLQLVAFRPSLPQRTWHDSTCDAARTSIAELRHPLHGVLRTGQLVGVAVFQAKPG